MVTNGKSPQRLWGFFNRKERWGVSWRGRLILALLGFSIAIFLFLNVQPFLAETHRMRTDFLVVEGWIHAYAIRAAVEEFKKGSYQRVFTTGGPVVGNGGYVNDYQTSASVGADLLIHAGVPPEFVQMIPSRVMDRDRTYGSAVALRDWLRHHNIAVQSLNVLTEDTHARRTRLLFQKALGKNVAVGVIAVPNPDYDAQRWWKYSEGVKDVVSEGFAYLYARFFFWTTRQWDDRTIGQRDDKNTRPPITGQVDNWTTRPREVRDYTKIKAWQLADDLTAAVYERTRSFPREEVYGLTANCVAPPAPCRRIS